MGQEPAKPIADSIRHSKIALDDGRSISIDAFFELIRNAIKESRAEGVGVRIEFNGPLQIINFTGPIIKKDVKDE